jgi:hypothetical protein
MWLALRNLLFGVKVKLSGFKVYTKCIVKLLLTQQEIVGPNSNLNTALTLVLETGELSLCLSCLEILIRLPD